MSATEILAELPKISPEERREILSELWQLEEASGPTSTEMSILNEAQTACDAAPSDGSPWPEAESRLRSRA